MTRKVMLIVVVLLSFAAILGAIRVYPHYRAACVAADRFIATATDGPWVRCKVRLVLDLPDVWGDRVQWIFRFRNPQTGNESKRIYVTFSGERAFSYRKVLDPVPLVGVRP
jgi:hypothetical protein